MLSVTSVGATTASSLARPWTRSLSRPSSSPSTRAPWPPCRIRPGAIQSAAQLTRHPTVRPAPTARAISSSLSPFCSDTIAPSAARRGARTSSAAGVSCDLTARSTRSSPGPSAPGEIPRTGTVTAPSRLSTVRPWAFIATTWSSARSTSRTSWPARASAAPVTPPIAPAPYTVIVIESLPSGDEAVRAPGRRGHPPGRDAALNCCRMMLRSGGTVNGTASSGASAQQERDADAHEDHVGRPRRDQRRQEVRARERQRHVVDDQVAGHDHDGQTDPEQAPAARRLQRERDRHEDHDQIHQRKRELRVELHEILADLEPRGLQLGDVVPELPEAHRAHRLLDPQEVLQLLLQIHRRPPERDRLHLAVGADLAVRALAQLPPPGRPVRPPCVEPPGQPELPIQLQDRHPVEVVRRGAQELDPVEPRVRAPHPQPLARLQVLGR